MLKSVVLPAPLGPIRAVIAWRGISRWSTSTAVRPPKRRVTLSITMMGSVLATPGTGSPLASPKDFARAMLPVTGAGSDAGAASSGCPLLETPLLDKGHLPLVAQNALGAEDHEQHQRHTDEDVAQRARLDIGHRQDAGLCEFRQQVAEEREDDPEDHRTERGTED